VVSRPGQRRRDAGVADHVTHAGRSPTSGDGSVPLGTPYGRLDAIVRERDRDGDSWAAHVAPLDRIATNRLNAERAGWTSLALERDGGLGRFNLFGVAPDAMVRAVVPDSVSLADHGA
jgi:hypothetical protein